MTSSLPPEYRGWWRIVDTGTRVKDGRLRGKIRIKNGDDSTFLAERTDAPRELLEEPPSYRDKWRRW